MEIKTVAYKRCTVVSVAGRIDSNTAPRFEQALKKVIEGGQSNVVLNMRGVEFISSAALRSMVAALKACKGAGGNLVLAEPGERVTEVLQLAGLMSLFERFDDVTAAVGSF